VWLSLKAKKRRSEVSRGNFSELEVLFSDVNGRDAEMHSSPKSLERSGVSDGV
jgi:hypothetical protein